MRVKVGMAFGTLVAVLVLATVAVYIGSAEIQIGEITTVMVVLALVAFAAYVIWDKAKNRSKGLPPSDERLANVNFRAGYYAFIGAIWSAVFVPMIYDGIFGRELEGHLVTAAVVSISGFVFAVSYLYMARKGR